MLGQMSKWFESYQMKNVDGLPKPWVLVNRISMRIGPFLYLNWGFYSCNIEFVEAWE